jgi:putative hemolysin
MSPPERNAFRFDLQPSGALGRAALSATRPLLERASGLRYMHRLYNRTPPELRGAELLAWVLRDLDVRVDVSDADLQRIPADGAAVLVANHPYGLIEGMLLPPLLAERRDDYRLMANYLLGRIPELKELFVYVDPFETGESRRTNTAPLRAAMRWVADGGLLAGFPAGEVASLHVRERQVLDPPWSHAFARVARHAECPVVPLWISGRNGWAFQTAGLVHPALRTALLCRQVAHRRGGRIEVRVGNPIPWTCANGSASWPSGPPRCNSPPPRSSRGARRRTRQRSPSRSTRRC